MSAFKATVKPGSNAATAETNAADFKSVEILATICYPDLVTPDPQSGKWQALFLVTDPESVEAVTALRDRAFADKFPRKEYTSMYHDPIRDANEKGPSGDFAFKHPIFREDGVVIRAKTGFEPTCVWGPNQSPIEAAEIHGGDQVVVEVGAYAFDNQSKGVSFSLGRIWLIDKGKVKVERGAGGSANVQRIDRSRLQFGSLGGGADEAA